VLDIGQPVAEDQPSREAEGGNAGRKLMSYHIDDHR
jgi:hypothetical protein